MSDRFDDLRAEYEGSGLAGELPDEPRGLFERWLDDARDADIPLSNAMALATATADGAPSVRMVLLKNIDDRGRLWFVTSYGSRKGAELEANPRASVLFYWEPLHRQIRVEGSVERLPAADSDRYFASRPRASNLSAMTSKQSERLPGGHAQLEAERAAVERAWSGRELERPEGWGGYAIEPERFEFWQGHGDRLHERLVYVRQGDAWPRHWLYP